MSAPIAPIVPRRLRTEKPTPSAWTSSLPELGEVTQETMDPVRIEEAVRDGYATGHAAGVADGHAAGYAAGYAEGEARGLTAFDEERRRLEAAIAALAAQLHQLTDAETAVRTAFEEAVLATAIELTRAIVMRELAVATDPGRDALRRALAVAPTPITSATVRLHPADAEHLGGIDDLVPGADLTVVPDATVAPGGCVLTVGDTSIDASIEAAVARVLEVLA